MRFIRNTEGNIVGYKTRNYCLIKHEGIWNAYGMCWYQRIPFFKWKLYSFKNRPLLSSNIFSVLGILLNLLQLSCFPAIAVFIPFYKYYVGATNFFKNGVWATNVRFFNWVNIIFMVIFLIWALLK